MDELILTTGAEEPGEAPLAHRAVRGSLWVAASSYVTMAYGLIMGIALIRLGVTPQAFGSFALAQFLFGVVNVRPKSGIGPAFAQRKETTGTLAATHLGLDIGAALLTLPLALAVAAISYVLTKQSWDVALIVLALAVVGVTDSLMGTAWIILDKALQLRVSNVVSAIAFILSYVPAIWLAFHRGGYWCLVAQNAVYSVLLTAGLWWTAWRRMPQLRHQRWRFDRTVASELLRTGRPIGASTVTGLLVSQLDNFYVGILVGTHALGLYNRAFNLAQWPSRLVTNIVSQAAFYIYVRLQDDQARLERTVTMSLWIITMLAMPIALGIFTAAPDLVRWLLKPDWIGAAVYLRYLVMYSALSPLLGDAGWLFVAVGRPRLTLQVSVVQVAVLATMGLALTLWQGVIGTCIAVGLTFVAGVISTYRNVLKVIRLRLWSSLGAPTVATAITLVGYLLIVRLLDTTSWPLGIAVAAKMVYGSGAYLIVVVLLQPRVTMERLAYVLRLARAGRTEMSP